LSFDLELINKRALVTGGTKGMGEATVARLRRGGAHVVTTARNRPAALQYEADFVQADVRRPRAALPSRGICSNMSAALISWSATWADRRRQAAARWR
jgi:NAD(P)-dependent dehydrogenase (short-subunit alcohol dehydrogenase family)